MAAGVRFEDRMSDSDALMWHAEQDPLLRSTIAGIWLLDRSPDPDRFAAKVERATRKIPRLRQRVVEDPFGLAPPRWEVDRRFELAYHVRRVGAPGDGSLRALLDFAAPIAMQGFDKDRPLWELHVIEGLAGGRAAVLMKLHHAVSDGVGMVQMTSGLVETFREPDPTRVPRPLPLPEGPTLGPAESTVDAALYRLREQWQGAGRIGRGLGAALERFARDPRAALERVSSTLESVARMLEPVREPLSPVMTGRSLAVHFDTFSVPLEELKRAGKVIGGTVNDAFVAAVAGGLRRYHEHLGAPVESLRMTMPINLREGENADLAGNQFAPARFAVPVGLANPVERMNAIHGLVRAQRAEPALPLFQTITGALNRLPTAASVALFGSMLKAIDFVTSNVPGPSFEVYVSGARVERIFGFGPLSGAAANVTVFSYDGTMEIGVATDPAAVKDPALLLECLQKAMDEVLAIV